jgi:hypothetical protein
MEIERPKADTQSLTLLKARLIKRLSIGIAVVNLFGAGTLLAVVPAKHQGLAGAGLLGLGVLGYLYKIEGAESIIRERIHKGGIILPEGKAGPHADDVKAIVRLSQEELERLEKVRDFIQTGRDLQKSLTQKPAHPPVKSTSPEASKPITSTNSPPVPTSQTTTSHPSIPHPSPSPSTMNTLSLDKLAQELGIPVPNPPTSRAVNNGAPPPPLAPLASLTAMAEDRSLTIAQETLPAPPRAIAHGSFSLRPALRSGTINLGLLAQSNGNSNSQNTTGLQNNGNSHEQGPPSPLRTTLFALQQEIIGEQTSSPNSLSTSPLTATLQSLALEA